MEALGQLRCDLFPQEPWDGRSPRGLTRVGLGVILKPGGVESVSDVLDPLQVLMFPRRRQRRRQSRTAPLLLPLPRVGG